MFNYIKLKNLLIIHKNRIILKKFKDHIFLNVNFKRNILEKNIYHINGVCISNKNKGISSTFILRNVIDLYPFEYIFNKYSPLIFFFIKKYSKNARQRKSKLYFLRNKAASYSRFKFNYITK